MLFTLWILVGAEVVYVSSDGETTPIVRTENVVEDSTEATVTASLLEEGGKEGDMETGWGPGQIQALLQPIVSNPTLLKAFTWNGDVCKSYFTANNLENNYKPLIAKPTELGISKIKSLVHQFVSEYSRMGEQLADEMHSGIAMQRGSQVSKFAAVYELYQEDVENEFSDDVFEAQMNAALDGAGGTKMAPVAQRPASQPKMFGRGPMG